MSSENVVLPLPYFGNILFYAVLMQKDTLLDLGENYNKQTIRNRCEILNDQGLQKLSIPVIKNTTYGSIREVEIDLKDGWHRNHLRSIKAAYGSSPFYEFYKDDLEDLWLHPDKNLVNFNQRCHEVLCRIMEWQLPLKTSADYIEDASLDIRSWFDKKAKHFYNTPYTQVFREKKRHVYNLSILDLIFNLGPASESYLRTLDVSTVLKD